MKPNFLFRIFSKPPVMAPRPDGPPPPRADFVQVHYVPAWLGTQLIPFPVVIRLPKNRPDFYE